MTAAISRRDFLNGALLASGGLLLQGLSPLELLAQSEDFNGYGGVGDYSQSNGNTLEVLLAGHQIRDGKFSSLPADLIDLGEIYDCVIVGGGISGLAAALFFSDSPVRARLAWYWIITPFLAARPNVTNSSWTASVSSLTRARHFFLFLTPAASLRGFTSRSE